MSGFEGAIIRAMIASAQRSGHKTWSSNNLSDDKNANIGELRGRNLSIPEKTLNPVYS